MGESDTRRTLLRETVLNGGLVLFGIVLLPVAVFIVGRVVFGTYEGDGFGGFFGALLARLFSGELAAWFLVLSPLLIVLIIRGIVLGWRLSARP